MSAMNEFRVSSARRPKKAPKLVMLVERVADARRIVDAQHALLVELRNNGEPAREAEGTLQTYVNLLLHLVAHEKKMTAEAKAKKGETRKRFLTEAQLAGGTPYWLGIKNPVAQPLQQPKLQNPSRGLLFFQADE
jgi:hypothetical protein